jgi:PKD repeat protein
MKRLFDLRPIKFPKLGKSIVGVLLALAAISVATAIPSAAYADSEPAESAGEISVQIEAGEYKIIEEDGVQRIRMPGYGTMQSPGDPALPEKILEFRVPDDIDWSTLKLTLEVVESNPLDGAYNVAPNPPLLLGNEAYWGEGKHIVDGKNMNVYGRGANFPEHFLKELPYTVRKEPVRIESEKGAPQKTVFETVSYVRVAYRPFQYNPVTRQLTLNEKATVKATYQRRGTVKSDQVMLQADGAGSYDYVIVTTNNIVSNSETLANFIHLKELQGYIVKVVTETDFSGLAGQYPNGRAEKIRQWLINNHAVVDFDYLLLIGDPDPDDPLDPADHVGNIPMKYGWTLYYSDWKCWDSASYRGTPTDLFYADLNGNWDLDGDGLYGEGLDFTNDPSPYPGEAVFDDGTFSVVWSGQIEFDVATTYRFHTLSDDGVELWIDGIKIIDDTAADDEPRNNFGSINRAAGKYDIELRYRAQNGAKLNSMMKLWWETPDLAEGAAGYIGGEIVPGNHLYDGADNVGGLDADYYSAIDFTGTHHTRKDSEINFNWALGDRGAGGPNVGADVYVGRIPVYDDDYAQLDAILEKIIRYETASDTAWRRTALLAMAPLSDTTPAYHYGEETMNNILTPAGFASYRLYDDDYAGSGGPTPDDYPSSVAKVKAEWQNGYGLVTWWTHGSPEGASHIFDSASAADLDDSKPSFTYQSTCLNGYPENNNNLGFALLKNGAVSTIAATRVSYGSRGAWSYDSTSSANPNFGYKYIENIVTNGHAAGPAFFNAKGMVAEVDHNGMNYNLNGDPAIYLLTTTPNGPPVADANGPYTGNEGSPVIFDASGSSDPEGDVLQYRWDFDNNGTWDTVWMDSPTASHTYCDNYIGFVTLEVRDGLGFTDTATAAVTVSNVAPAPNAGGDQTVNEGDTVYFSGSFTDPGSCDTHTYQWTFGDGSPAVTGTLTPEHAYGDNGVYTVTLTVTDDDGGVGVGTLVVTVNNVAPAVTGISMGQPNPQFILPIVHTLDFEGNFTDPGWLDTHTSTWDFGDGVIVPGTVSEENVKPDATGNATASHAYGEPGTYTVTLTVTDDDGGSDVETMQVVVVTAEEAKHDINDYIQSLPDSAFKGNPDQRKKALDNMFYAIDDMLADEEYQGAIKDLTNNIRPKVDGTGTDWIIDPAAQAELMMKIDDLVAYLEYLKTL